MVKKPETLKKAAREDAKAAQAEDAGFEREEEEQGGAEAKKRKARPAKLRRDNKKKREQAVREKDKKERDGDDKDDEDFLDRRIFVANLPEKTTCDDLRELFEKFGTVHSARLHVNSKGQFRGVGFVTFESTEELEEALKLNGMEYKKQTLKVEKAQPPPKRVAFDVFVGGLPYAAEEKKIRKHFKACGELKKVRMNIDPVKKKFNGTAFLRFKTAAGAEAGLKLHDSMFAGRTLTVKLALPKKKLTDRKDIEKVEAPKQQQPAQAGGESKRAKKRRDKPGNAGGEAAEAKGETQKAEKPAPTPPVPAEAKGEKRKAEKPAPTPPVAAEAKGEKRKASEIAAEESSPKKKKKTLKKKKKAQA